MATENKGAFDSRLAPFFDDITYLAVNGCDPDQIVHYLSLHQVVVTERDVEQFIEEIALAAKLMTTTPEQFMKTIFPREMR